MRLITAFELATRSETALAALCATVALVLARSAPGSGAQRNARATMENIRREQIARRNRPRP